MGPQTLHDSIVSFLNSNSVKKPISRCHCGATMKPYKTTFFYDGQSWNIVLEVCLKCRPEPSVPISHTNRIAS